MLRLIFYFGRTWRAGLKGETHVDNSAFGSAHATSQDSGKRRRNERAPAKRWNEHAKNPRYDETPIAPVASCWSIYWFCFALPNATVEHLPVVIAAMVANARRQIGGQDRVRNENVPEPTRGRHLSATMLAWQAENQGARSPHSLRVRLPNPTSSHLFHTFYLSKNKINQ
ncbi:hypothetical protein [Pandoraea cepalis]|uniref:hypothetical protein n=1 Tax=Pandoraea cepalis TaxID=2508294 RepID=UPI00123FDA26|nr:hypothetical protein [Pandoraea cepalis]